MPLLAPLCLSWHCWTIVSHRGEELGVPLILLSSNFPNFPSQQFGVSKWLLPRVQPDLRQVASHTPKQLTPKLMIIQGDGVHTEPGTFLWWELLGIIKMRGQQEGAFQ